MRNIHVTASPEPQRLAASQAEEARAASTLPRLREVTNSPAREFANRPGETEPVPEAVIACILHRQAREMVTRDGIAFIFEGQKYKFWAENSVTLSTKVGQRVLITFNRHALDVIHILDEDGTYIETLPRKGEVDWFDPEASKRELDARKRFMNRTIERLEHLHQPDTEAALDRARHNEGQLKKVVQNFPLPENGRTSPVGPSPQLDSSVQPSPRQTHGVAERSRPPFEDDSAPRLSQPAHSLADPILQAERNAVAQRENHQRRTARTLARIEAEEDDFTTLQNTRERSTPRRNDSVHSVTMEELNEL